MANFLDFDAAGVVSFPTAVAAGDFSIEFGLLEAVRTGTAIGIIAGNATATSDFIAYTNQLRLTCRVATQGMDSGLQAITEGTFVKAKFERISGVLRLYINDNPTPINQANLAGVFTLGTFGAYANGALKYSGSLFGYIHMTGFDGGERYYDIANSTGTTLTDTISGQNGTLSGFTTGGFKVQADTTAPVITLLGDNPLTVNQGGTYTDPGFTATDNIDGNLSANVIVAGSVNTAVTGAYNITYNVSDAAGNAAIQRTRVVNVVAVVNNAPVITLTGANPLTLIQGTAYVEPGFTATDTEDGNITGSVVVTGTIDENTISSQQLTYSVTDSGGLTTQVTRTVNVVASEEVVNVTSPLNFACKQRAIGGEAVFTVSGTYSTAQIFEYSINGGTSFIDINTVASTSFNDDVTIVGQVDLIIRAKGIPASATTIQKVTSAMSICIAPAQSGGSGRLDNNQVVTLNPGAPVPMMYKLGNFSVLEDPTGEEGISKGSIWPLLVEKYANAGIPVCLNNIGVGGSTISMWQPGGSRHNNIIEFATAMGGLEILASLIGESDAQNSTPKDTFKSSYISCVQPINAAYGAQVNAIYFPVGAALNANPSRVATIRLAYDELIAENSYINFGGDLAVIDLSDDGDLDTLHLTTDADAIEAANIIYSAFTGEEPTVESTLNMTLIGIPDGPNDTRIINPTDSGSLVFFGSLSWLNNSVSYTVNLPAGTTLEYSSIGESLGGLDRGVTV